MKCLYLKILADGEPPESTFSRVDSPDIFPKMGYVFQKFGTRIFGTRIQKIDSNVDFWLFSIKTTRDSILDRTIKLLNLSLSITTLP